MAFEMKYKVKNCVIVATLYIFLIVFDFPVLLVPFAVLKANWSIASVVYSVYSVSV